MGLFLNLVGLLEYIGRVLLRVFRFMLSRKWEFVSGEVLGTGFLSSEYGCSVAEVYYEYFVGGVKNGGVHSKPFLSQSFGRRYAESFSKGAEFVVRVNPRKPSVSVAE